MKILKNRKTSSMSGITNAMLKCGRINIQTGIIILFEKIISRRIILQEWKISIPIFKKERRPQ